MEHQANLLFRKIKYILQMSPVFNTAAIFSDETENYVHRWSRNREIR